MTIEARAAYNSWRDQRHRCGNSRVDCYKYYGAKGIEVKYCAREFVGWWLEQLKSFVGVKPTISRIDHDGHYEFGNVKLEGHKENCVTDVLNRHGAPGFKCTVPVDVFDYKTGLIVRSCSSMREASIFTGVAHSNVNAICRKRGRVKSGKGFTFRYAEAISAAG